MLTETSRRGMLVLKVKLRPLREMELLKPNNKALKLIKAPDSLNRPFRGLNQFKLTIFKWLVVRLNPKSSKLIVNDLDY